MLDKYLNKVKDTLNITDEKINQDASETFEKVNNNPKVSATISIAAVVSLAKNINILLKDEKINKEKKSKLLQDVVVATGVVGITSLIFFKV